MRVRLLALLTVGALLLASCGNAGEGDDDDQGGGAVTTASGADLDENIPSTEPGVTDDEIRVAVITSKTNPLGGKYAELADGIQAYFDKVNADGGIYGRDLVITSQRDDVVGLNQLQEVESSLAEDNAFATFIASLGGGGLERLDAAGMPTFIWNIRPEMAGKDHVFGHLGALCFGCTGQVLPWLVQQLGYTKVGVLGYGVAAESKECAKGNRDSFEDYGNAEVVFYDDTIPFAGPLDAQVAQMKQRGVEFITTCMDINEAIVLAKELRKQNLDAVQHLPNGYDPALVEANADLLEGSFVIPQFLALENQPQIPEIKEFLDWLGRADKEFVELSAVGWILAAQFVEGLKLAGPEFTQEGVVDSLNTVTDMRVNGFMAPIDWTKQHADPKTNPDKASDLECANIVKVEGGKFVPVYTEPGKPWLCFENDAPELKDPEPTTFAPEL